MYASLRRYVSPRILKTREEYFNKKFPNYPGKRVEQLPRAGSHGGQFADPAKTAHPLSTDDVSSTYKEFLSNLSESVESDYIEKFKNAPMGTDKAEVLDEYITALQAIKDNATTVESLRQRRMDRLKEVDTNSLNTKKPGIPDSPKIPRYTDRHKIERPPQFKRDTKARLRMFERKDEVQERFTDLTAQRAARVSPAETDDVESDEEIDDDEDLDEEDEDLEEMMKEEFIGQNLSETFPGVAPASINAMRESRIGKLWASLGCKNFVEYQNTAVPSFFESAVAEYFVAKKSSLLVDESYRCVMEITGPERKIVGDHFLTASLKTLRVGESTVACILDSKGLILDMCDVLMGPDKIWVVSHSGGEHFRRMFEYLSQYVVYARDSGLNARIRQVENASVLTAHGPKSMDYLISASESSSIQYSLFKDPSDVIPDRETLSDLPVGAVLSGWIETEQGSGCELHVYRRVGTGVDGFTMILVTKPENVAKSLVESGCTPGGIYALDMLRMEAGTPRAQVDTTSLLTPVSASLVWTLDQAKMRLHAQFGWRQIFSQLAKGPTYRRVGLLSDRYVHAGCLILSCPDRRLIGEITSVAWNPQLNKRLCQGYIKPEYAKVDKQVHISVPMDIPELQKASRARKISKQGMKQSVFRKLVDAQVIGYPITESPIKVRANTPLGETRRARRFNPTRLLKRSEGRLKKLVADLQLPPESIHDNDFIDLSRKI